MDIDWQAPIIARAQTTVQAKRRTVWDVLADPERWPDWNPDIREVSLKGPMAPGTEFSWKAGPGRIRSRLQIVDPPSKIVWTGRTFGIRAVDAFRLEEALGGGTLVVQEESWSGLPARLFRKRLRRMLQDSLAAGLQALKAEAERRDALQKPSRRRISLSTVSSPCCRSPKSCARQACRRAPAPSHCLRP